MKYIIYNLVFIFCFFVTIEIIFRQNDDITLLGTNKNLFAENRIGDMMANAPSADTVSFGTKVYTDLNGFRVPSQYYKYPDSPDKRILFLGDSVSFGPGVKEESTFIGILRKTYKNWLIHNTAVIGYSFDNYYKVADHYLSQKTYDLGVLVICLNDNQVKKASKKSKKNHSDSNKYFEFINWIKKNKIFLTVNNFLIPRSKFYVYLKGTSTQPQRRLFYQDLENYIPRDDTNFEGLKKLVDLFEEENIPLIIIIAPYNHQLSLLQNKNETNNLYNEILLPQKRINDYLKINKVDNFFDPITYFIENMDMRAEEYYIKYDHNHFSTRGHLMMHYYLSTIIKKDLKK